MVDTSSTLLIGYDHLPVQEAQWVGYLDGVSLIEIFVSGDGGPVIFADLLQRYSGVFFDAARRAGLA